MLVAFKAYPIFTEYWPESPVIPPLIDSDKYTILFEENYHTFTKKGIVDCIRTPELEDNIAIHQLWKHFDPVTFRRRLTYKKEL